MKTNILHIKAKFKLYPYVVCDDKRILWQLEHFKYRRTCPMKKLTYNEERKAYRINSQWVSKKRLYKFMIKCDEVITKEFCSSNSLYDYNTN